MQVTELRLTDALLGLTLSVRNTGENDFTLNRIDYKVYGNNQYLGDGYSDQVVQVPAGGAREITSPFTVSYVGAAGITRSAIQENQVVWKVTGTARFTDALGVTRTVAF